MKLSRLPKLSGTQRGNKRVGRGHGSGKGKTAGRGTKGQNARGKVRLSFEGGQLALIKRLPFQRGKSRFKPLSTKPMAVNVKVLNLFEKGETVSLETLIAKGIVIERDARLYGVKVLGDGDLNISLTVSVPVSANARKKIEAAGGVVSASSGDKQ